MRLFSFLGQAPVTLPRSSRCLRRGAQSDAILHRLIHPRSLLTQSCMILPQRVVDEPEWARLQGLLPLLLVCSGALLVSFLFSSETRFRQRKRTKMYRYERQARFQQRLWQPGLLLDYGCRMPFFPPSIVASKLCSLGCISDGDIR